MVPGVSGLRWQIRLSVLAVALIAASAAIPATPVSAENIAEKQWHLAALHIAEAQRISTGTGVVVAVLDSGVQAEHPDLAGQVLAGTRISGRADQGRTDVRGHGTGVAGLIAARGGGPDHALGIAPGAKILPVGILNGVGFSELPQAIRWSVDHGAKVINISFGENNEIKDEIDALRYAADHDVVVVAAGGNKDVDFTKVPYPARVPGVVAVAATDRAGSAWTGGVTGPEIALAAPGVDITTLINHQPDGKPGGYQHVTGGTSASAPIVAGVAALIRSKYPQLSAADVINRLIRTADDAGPPGRDPQYGFGIVNPVKALTADVPPVSSNPLVAASDPASSPSATAADRRDRPIPIPPLMLVLVGALAVGAVLVALIVVVVARRR
jgi:type VII secretion-associated serine protease mycosin